MVLTLLGITVRQFVMNLRILFILFSLLMATISFAQNSNAKEEIENLRLPEYPIKTIYSFCQGDTTLLISQENIVYNSDRLPLESVLNFNPSKKLKKKFSYDENQKTVLVSSYWIEGDLEKQFQTIVFKYNSNGDLAYEEISELSDTVKKITYDYYRKGQLKCKSISGKDWKESYTYEYDSIGRLISQLRDTKPYMDYQYDQNGRLIKVIEYNKESSREVIYKYDTHGFLAIKEREGKILENNAYSNGRLVSQSSSYFGKDPCAEAICCMQWLKKFKYY